MSNKIQELENQNLPSKIEKVLVVGSWAKEQATIENLKENKEIKVLSYLDTKNPGIIREADDYRIGELDQTQKIVEYASQNKVDLVLITTAEPLGKGVVDALERESILCFAPRKKAAQLETNKHFARRLMKKHNIDAVPSFKVFQQEDEAIKYAKELNWQVAVKPIGLTEGLGVKVYKEQLQTPEEVQDYIHKVLEKKIGNAAKVLVEEKMEGEEFTIQCFVNGTDFVASPCVQDFKKLLAGGEGPNTASMGSYSTKQKILPFMTEDDYRTALNIIEKTLSAYQKETGEICRGFLYGQFIHTSRGIKLVEYNFRPGDPEWLNTLAVMEEPLHEVILKLMEEEDFSITFQSKTTVCKYIVPPEYPEELYQTLDVSFDESKIQQMGVDLYYSCGKDKDQELNVGSERGIALIGKGTTIEEANRRVEKAISQIKGDFHYRNDIGTESLIQETINVSQRGG